MASLGLDPALVRQAIDDPTTHDDVKADHYRVTGLGGWGVPTLVFPAAYAGGAPARGARAVPARAHRPAAGEAAVRLWRLLTGWLEFPALYGIQRPKRQPDLHAIGHHLPALPRGQGLDHDSEGDTMTDLATARDSLLGCYDAIEDLGGRMTAADWQVQSLCPDWKARDVIQHLAMMERVMAGWLPDSSDEVPDFGRVAHFTEEMAGLDDAASAGVRKSSRSAVLTWRS